MFNRRQFAVGVGSSGLLIGAGALGGCSRTENRLAVFDREPTWANSICQLCPSACGLRFVIANGSPVNVAGNPIHPINRGGMCARGGASLQLYYDPDRLAGPVQRQSGVIGGWAKLDWEQALSQVGEKLKGAAAGGSNRVALIRGNGRDLDSQMLGRLVRAAGSDWVVDMAGTGTDLMERVTRSMHGTSHRVIYDLARSDFLLSFDSGLLDASPDSMSLHRSFAQMRANNGKFMHAGPRMGITGTKADSWLPIKPSTIGVLALGIAHILIKERMTDDAFLRDRSWRFNDWTTPAGTGESGLRKWILREFSPMRVSETTGIGWEQIIQAARAFGSAKRPLAIGPVGTASGFTLFDLMAVHALNVMVGSIDVPGGVLFEQPMPLKRFEELDKPGGPAQTRTLEDLAQWILSDRKPTVDVVFIHNADPVFTSAAGAMIEKALAKVPLVVSTSPVLNDTTAVSHMVLPDLLAMEKRCDASTVDANGYPVVSMSPPAARPRTDGRATGSVALSLAKGTGNPLAQAFPWASYDEVLDAQVRSLSEAGSGDTFSDDEHSVWAQLIGRRGWRIPSYRNEKELARNMANKGGWWSPNYYHGQWPRIVSRPDGRVDVWPVQLAANARSAKAAEDPPVGQLRVHVYSELIFDTSLSGSLPYLQDLGSPFDEAGWNTLGEINTKTALSLGIRHGEPITVSTKTATMNVIAQHSEGIRPDVIAINAGNGRVQGGRYAAGFGNNPLRLVGPGNAGIGDDTVDAATLGAALVTVEKTRKAGG